MASEVICIRHAGTVEEADIIIAWLADHGIEAFVTDRTNPGVLAFGVTDAEGVKICVSDEETAGRAVELLKEHDRERSERTGAFASADAAPAKCEECGQECTFPADTRGTVQRCPNCDAHIDVPEGDS